VVTIWNVDEQKVARTITVDAAKFESFVFGGRAFRPNGQQFATLVDVRPIEAKSLHPMAVPTSWGLWLI